MNIAQQLSDALARDRWSGADQPEFLRAMAAWAKDNLRLRVSSPQGSPRDITLELQVRSEDGDGVTACTWETVSEVGL